jgi:DNA repair protein RecO (recombination protein O)
MLTKDKAICIRTVDYSETSQIATFLTHSNGKVSAIAKGSKRPKSAFGGPIEVLAEGQIVFTDSSREKLSTLTEFEQHGVRGLTQNLFVMNCCLFAAELVNAMTDDYDPHPELYNSFSTFLTDATQHDEGDMLAFLILFQLSLLKETGLWPVLNACSNCGSVSVGQNTKAHFSSLANGLLCRDCDGSFPDKIAVTTAAADCLADLKKITKAGESTLNELERILVHHFTELLHKRPRMAKYILQC